MSFRRSSAYLLTLALTLSAGIASAQDGAGGGEGQQFVSLEDTPRKHLRMLFSGNVKVNDILTVGAWYAQYRGKPWPFAGRDMFWYSDYDLVPGFQVSFGKIHGISLNGAAEIYFLEREYIDEKDSTYVYNTADYAEYRPRLSLSATYPVAPWLHMQHISRWERRVISSPAIFSSAFSRYRPTFKVLTSEIASLANLQVFASYESFIQKTVRYWTEIEFGAGIRPRKDLSVRLGQMLQLNPGEEKTLSYMTTLYASYTFDLHSLIKKD